MANQSICVYYCPLSQTDIVLSVYFTVLKEDNLCMFDKTRGLIATPFIISFLATENVPKLKLGQVEMCSNTNLTNNEEVISGNYYTQFI